MPLIDLQSSQSVDDFFNEERGDHWQVNQLPEFWTAFVVEAIEKKENNHILRKCFGDLSDHQIGILQEKYFEEKSSEEICKEFNISKSNY